MSRIGRTMVVLVTAVACVAGPAKAAPAAMDPACEVTYKPSEHTGGFNAAITIRNTGVSTLRGWTFKFPLDPGEAVIRFSNAELVEGTGVVVARNLPYNGEVPRDGKVYIGFEAFGSPAGEPSQFSVNEVPCTVIRM